MISRSVKSRSIYANGRLDCKYFLSPGTQAAERIALAEAAGIELRSIGGSRGMGRAWAPGRFKRVYAVPGEPGAPYLRPYDVFDYVPTPADHLSVARSDNLDTLMAPPGSLLLTCSGRNLGPAVAVDAHLSRFALSHDLIRIEIEDEVDRLYTLAFLGTRTGQALIRRDKTGSVIDHISVEHIRDIAVPFIDGAVRGSAANHMGRAILLREEARLTLAAATEAMSSALPRLMRTSGAGAVWTVQSSALSDRVDAASYHPAVVQIRDQLRAAGGPRLGDVADVRKPSGRYKTYYVESTQGRALLSGRQVLQCSPVNLQFIAPRSLDPARYELHAGWIAMQADGRSEERLGLPVMIEPARENWLASGHVGRLVPEPEIDPGWLYVAVSSEQVQLQIKALACGSVVDALYEEDLRDIMLPPVGSVNGSDIRAAWEKFSSASRLETAGIALVENELDHQTGGAQPST